MDIVIKIVHLLVMVINIYDIYYVLDKPFVCAGIITVSPFTDLVRCTAAVRSTRS